MTDHEAFVAWQERVGYRYEHHVTEIREETWHAALAYLRSQGEPVAHGVGPGDWTYTLSAPVRVGTKLYLAPVAKVPEGWQLVPKEPTAEMLAEASSRVRVNEFSAQSELELQGDAHTTWDAMLAAAPEYEEERNERRSR